MPPHDLTAKIKALETELEGLRQNKEAAQIALKLFELFANRLSRRDFLYSAAEVLKHWSGCRNIGIRLIRKDGLIPYEAAIGFSPEFMAKENMLSLQQDDGICIRVIGGRIQPNETGHSTPHGSFFLTDAPAFLAGLNQAEAARYRGNCIHEGFSSIAVVPVKRRDRILGAIQMTDKRKNRVSLPVIELAESLAGMIGEAIHHIHTEEALRQKDLHIREQYAELDQIYTHAPYGLCLMDKDLKLLRINRRISDFIGKPEADIVGKPLKTVIHKLSPRLEKGMLQVIQTGEPVLNIETRAVSPHTPARERNFLVSLYPHRCAQQEIKGVNAIVREITENRRMERELKTYAGLLEEKNRELENFAFVASHDLQEPLRKIQVFGNLIHERSADRMDAAGLDYLVRMQSASRRMQGLISDLLDYSRISTRTAPFVLVDLNRVIQEVIGDLEIPIRETAARFEIGELPIIEADPTQMRQLFQNLIGNAVKYNRNAPLVRIHGEPGSQPGGPDGSPQLVSITVADNGIGFQEKYAERIFRPLERLHDRSQYAGTGMGLAIVQKIVNVHGGWITAKGKPNQGATFIVTLPVSQRPPSG